MLELKTRLIILDLLVFGQSFPAIPVLETTSPALVFGVIKKMVGI